jgi:hypothetical protein
MTTQIHIIAHDDISDSFRTAVGNAGSVDAVSARLLLNYAETTNDFLLLALIEINPNLALVARERSALPIREQIDVLAATDRDVLYKRAFAMVKGECERDKFKTRGKMLLSDNGPWIELFWLNKKEENTSAHRGKEAF